MALLKIARMGHPVLRGVAEPVSPAELGSPGFQRLLDDLLETLRDAEALSLALPQVHTPLRALAVLVDGEPLLLVNPELSYLTRRRLRSYEGCLSVPGIRAVVERPARVRVDALDRHGQVYSAELEGLAALSLQHACDHLDGLLFLDRCDRRSLAFVEELRRYGPLDPAFQAGRRSPAPEEE